MVYVTHFLTQVVMLCILVMIFVDTTGAESYDYNIDDFVDIDTFGLNESLPITPSIDMKNSTNTPSSLSSILKVLSTRYTSTNEVRNKTKNESTASSLLPTSITPRTAASITSASSLVDQFNYYHNIEILSHIKECDPNMTLNDMCETYSIDNDTNLLKPQSNIEFPSLQDLSDALVDRMTVQQLNKFGLSNHWHLENLTQDKIHSTNDVIRKRGRSFCLLEQCHHRLIIHINSCPFISNKNMSIPTLKVLPMLCSLYNEQQSWNSTQCIEGIIYILHILYAFWPELETCQHGVTNICTPECQTFDSIFHLVENQCDGNASFLSRVPILSWYQLINLKQRCRQKSISTRFPLINSMKKFFSSNTFWYRFHQEPVYTASFIFIVICIVISFSLCFYFKSKHRSNLTHRRLDDDYEYTRLHNTSFELGPNTEIPNLNSSSDRIMNESNDHPRLSEYQRLLHVES